MKPEFRLLSRSELDTVMKWAAAEGWNPGLDDAEAFWAADSEGFYAMELDGKLIGSASIVSYSGKQGFIGLFIVRPQWRGKGLGTQFWNFLIPRMRERLDAGASASLDGVFAMQEYYAKSGFVFTHRNLRMEGVGSRGRTDPSLVELGSLDLDEVIAYDALHFGTPRPKFWKQWIQPRGGVALALPGNGGLAGIGVLRPCARGFKIGPLFAEGETAANTVFDALSNFAQGEPIFLDTPENNSRALALAERRGMKESFGCARMVMGSIPNTPWENIYGVTTFELG